MVKSFIRANRKASEDLIQKFPSFFSISDSYNKELMLRIRRAIARDNKPVILEAGGIDRPLLEKSDDYVYVGLDIENKERCYDVYDQFIVQSIEQPVDGCFDVIISKTLLEHVPDNKASIKSMYNSLKPGGTMHHYIPAKWHPYSIALRLVGPTLQRKLIARLRPAAVDVTGYQAFFNHCSVGQMKRLCKKAGFIDVDVKPYFRANDYFAFLVPMFIMDTFFENICQAFNLSLFCSGFVLSAKRPA
jgi:SAM-dependent methyltransferase